jgi:hypothetical protein
MPFLNIILRAIFPHGSSLGCVNFLPFFGQERGALKEHRGRVFPAPVGRSLPLQIDFFLIF